jgi:purine-nucleoside phosphorylase
LKVLGLSLITNAALATRPESAKLASQNKKTSVDIVDQTEGMASHAEVLENANAAANDLKAIVELFVSTL